MSKYDGVVDGLDKELILRILSATELANRHISWRTSGDFAPLTIFANCDDLFYWGGGDDEPITPDNIDIFEQSLKDAHCDGPDLWSLYGSDLFCARLRKMRPQGAFYTLIPREMWPLFDECGPEREVGLGNPHKPGEGGKKD